MNGRILRWRVEAERRQSTAKIVVLDAVDRKLC